jgi:hypothetical protein
LARSSGRRQPALKGCRDAAANGGPAGCDPARVGMTGEQRCPLGVAATLAAITGRTMVNVAVRGRERFPAVSLAMTRRR